MRQVCILYLVVITLSVYWWEYWLTTVPSRQVVPNHSPDYNYSSVCSVHLYSSKVVSSEKPIGSFELTPSHSGLFIHFYSVKKSSYPLNLETFKNTEIIRYINIYTWICLSNYHITYISILGLKICQLNSNVSCCHNELMEDRVVLVKFHQ